MGIRIIIADDHEIMREGLRTLIEKHKDLEMVGEAGDGQSVIELARKIKPDIVIMDVHMKNLNGIVATRQIVSENPKVKVIGLSMHSERRFVLEMLKGGASGYLLKDNAFQELVQAVRAVMSGRIHLCPQIAAIILKDYLHNASLDKLTAFSVLTDRERQVLQFIAEGKTTKETASLLGVSTKTVETFRQQIMAKLDIHSIAGLTKFAIREGLTPL